LSQVIELYTGAELSALNVIFSCQAYDAQYG